MSFDESSILEVVEKVSKNVVNINTVRLLHDYYFQVAPVQGVGSGVIIAVLSRKWVTLSVLEESVTYGEGLGEA